MPNALQLPTVNFIFLAKFFLLINLSLINFFFILLNLSFPISHYLPSKLYVGVCCFPIVILSKNIYNIWVGWFRQPYYCLTTFLSNLFISFLKVIPNFTKSYDEYQKWGLIKIVSSCSVLILLFGFKIKGLHPAIILSFAFPENPNIFDPPCLFLYC